MQPIQLESRFIQLTLVKTCLMIDHSKNRLAVNKQPAWASAKERTESHAYHGG